MAERSKALASGASPKGRGFESHFCHFGMSHLRRFMMYLPFRVDVGGQFARAVKGVVLRSTADYCAWVRTPQLTFLIACRYSFELRLVSI